MLNPRSIVRKEECCHHYLQDSVVTLDYTVLKKAVKDLEIKALLNSIIYSPLQYAKIILPCCHKITCLHNLAKYSMQFILSF